MKAIFHDVEGMASAILPVDLANLELLPVYEISVAPLSAR
jgi:hypothetical protein